MFGDMFEESETLVQGCAPKPSKQNGNTFEAPPPLRGDTGFCGIKNQGATCYLNSLIQTLLLTPEFREELFRLGPDELGKLDDVKKKNSKVRIIPIQLQMLLARLLLIEQYACGTEGLTESFGWVDNEELQQHDVQELSRILFCAIEDSLVGTSGHEIIKNLYRGVIANTTQCLNCKKVSERPEDFLDLNVAIASQSTLCDVLRDMFVETELMSGKNQYHCDNCAKLVDARKGAIIKTLPPILTVSLLRFSFDYQTLRRFKETRKFDFPLTLNMKPYCEKSSSECYEYDLYSVIIHSGGAHGGHYHAYIRDVDGLGSVPNDYNPTPPKPCVSPKNTSLEADCLDDPLEMVATILGKLGGENVPLHKLGEAFREDSGMSWSKHYKRKYGTMIKFLQNNYETFSVDTRVKTVSFRSNSNCASFLNETATSGHDLSFAGYESGDSILIKTDHDPVLNGHEQMEGVDDGNLSHDKESDENDHHPLCNVWFDFNDSHIKSITTHEIETQFEGRESAYMLFYRRRDLKRPLISLGNAVDSIPGHIMAQIQKENSDLEVLRKDYDVYLNVVTVQVYFPSMLTLEDGLLKLKVNEESEDVGYSYSIDRRKTIADMNAELFEMLEKHNESELIENKDAVRVNLMKVLTHGGVHVYEQIDSDKSLVICDSILVNNMKLLLWDGNEIQGKKVLPGDDFEPKVLNIHCEVEGDPEICSFEYRGVSRGDVSLDSLRQYFLNNFKLKEVVCCEISQISNKGSFVKLDNYDDKLCDVLTTCHGNFMIKICLKEDSHETPDKDEGNLTLHITLTDDFDKKLHEMGIYGYSDGVYLLTSMSCVVKVSSFIFVEHLKSKIPRWLFPQFSTEFKSERTNLCIENIDTVGSLAISRLTLHEQQSLASAGLSNVANVTLDDGPPLKRNLLHVAVCVQKGSKLKLPVKKCQFVKFDCVKTQNAKSLIEKVVSEFNLLEDAYHLRILKSEKEVGDVITNPDSPVEKTLIEHGCALILCPGKISSEGQLRVPIWFYPSLMSFDDLIKKVEENDLSPWSPFLDENDIKPVQVGHVTLDKDSTIFDIKAEVALLDYFKAKKIESEDICLRSMSHKLPTKFHLQENAMIKKLRLGPTNPLAVTLKSCIPQDGYTTVRLSFNIPGTRNYTNDCELQWEKTTSFSKFPAKVAERFDVLVKDVLVAKRGEEAWEWEIVKTRDAESKEKHSAKAKKNSKQKKVQSKSKPKRSSIKQPSTLQDGDLVRVKKIVPNLDNAPVVTDFKSEEEVALYGRWCVSRHKESNSLSANQPPENEAKKANPKKEETLRIHVDKF